MKNRSQRLISISKAGAYFLSRRDVLARGAGALCALALPEFLIRNAWGQTATFDYYISKTGNDANAGTLAAPWALTSCAVGSSNNAKMAGKRTGFLPGTYNLNTLPSIAGSNYENCLMAIPHGSSSAQTYWGTSNASGVYQQGTAILYANNVDVLAPSSGGGILGENATAQGYWTVDGFIIDGTGMTWGGHFIQAFSNGGEYTGSTPGACPGIIVQNCEMRTFLNGAGNGGGDNDTFVFFEGTSGSIVQNCYFHNMQKPAQADPHMHAIEEYGCYGNQYIHNTFANISNGATAIESKAGGAAVIVAYNYFYNINPGQSGVIMGFDGAEGSPNSQSNPYLIHHNIFDSCPSQIKSVDINNQDTQGIYWYNNTVYNPSTASSPPAGQFATSGSSAPIYHYNNIWNTTSGSVYVNLTNSSITVCDYNCYATASVTGNTGFDKHSITSNPTFSTTITPGSGSNQFQLASGSPCLGAGRVGGLSTGVAVNMGAWDGTVTQIGCNFLSGSLVPNAPTLTVS